MFPIDYSILPEHMREGIRLYVEKGTPPGNFLYAVLCNSLVDAFKYADDINLHRIPDYAAFLYNELPCTCWGSQENVDQWILVGGWLGKKEKELIDNGKCQEHS